jgi:hypothetical protein
MLFCKRFVAGLALILGAAGLLLSIAGGIGFWIIKEPMTQRLTSVFERIESALQVADKGLADVKTILGNAAERLEDVKKEQRKLAQEPKKDSALGRLLARKVQKIGPEVGGAQNKLETIAEAAVVVNSVLEDLGNLPFLSTSGLDVDRLKNINSLLSDVPGAAWELSRLLGDPDPEEDAKAAEQLSRIEQVLKRMEGLIAEYEPQLNQVRRRTEDLKAGAFHKLSLATVIIPLACIWIALAQFSLLCHGWTWWRGVGRKSSP